MERDNKPISLEERKLRKAVEDKENELYGGLKEAGSITEDASTLDKVLSVEEIFSTLLVLPDDEFRLVAPLYLNSVESSLNNPVLRTQIADTVPYEDMVQFMETMTEMLQPIAVDESMSEDKKMFAAQLAVILTNFFRRVVGSVDNVSLVVKYDNEEIKRLAYAHEGDSGLDIYSAAEYDIAPGETVVIPTGVRMVIPSGYEVQVRDKSGIASKTKLRVANAPSTIDSNYRGDIGVIIENIEAAITKLEVEPVEIDGKTIYSVTNVEYGRSFHIDKGQKIAQLVLTKVAQADLIETVEDLPDNTTRGERGFGSTGLV